MARRRPLFDRLEERLCMAAGPTLQTTFPLPSQGSWTPTTYRASPLFVDIFGTGKEDLITVTTGAQLVAYSENPDGTAKVDIVYGERHDYPIATDSQGRFRVDALVPGRPAKVWVSPNSGFLSGTVATSLVLRPGEVKDLGNVREAK